MKQEDIERSHAPIRLADVLRVWAGDPADFRCERDRLLARDRVLIAADRILPGGRNNLGPLSHTTLRAFLAELRKETTGPIDKHRKTSP